MERNEKHKWLLCVSCMTYNHSAFIKETLDGFCMQETSFPYVCTIVDDASEDGEPGIILNYFYDNFDMDNMSILRKEETADYFFFFSHHKNNKNCFFAVLLLKYNHYRINKQKFSYLSEWRETAKYLAICEGDDYWIDPHKLQKQVDYLESHPECNLVYTDVNSYHQDSGTVVNGFFGRGIYRRIKNTHKDLILWGWFLAPCTWVYRNGIVEYPEVRNPNMFYGDTFIALNLSEHGTIHFINEVSSVYRVLSESASHSKDPSRKIIFWQKGRYTRATFAVRQSFFFRFCFLCLNTLLAINEISKRDNKGFRKIIINMIKKESKLLF